jgi:hypothetical protein
MPDLGSVDGLEIRDQFLTLGRTDNATFTLGTDLSSWTGTARFRVETWGPSTGLVLTATERITVPLEDMEQFTTLLQDAPLVDVLPQPTPSAIPDNYRDYEMELRAADRRVVSFVSKVSTWGRLHRSPYAVYTGAEEGFTPDDTVDRASCYVYKQLRYDTLDELIRLAENPALLTATPVRGARRRPQAGVL